jgi:uncharacterized membrane protein
MLEQVGLILLGLFLLLAPGFLLTLVLFPRWESLDPWSRVALSVGLGALVVIYAGVLLALPPLRMLRLVPLVGTILVFCAACVAIAYARGGLATPASHALAALRALRRPRPSPAQPEPTPLEGGQELRGPEPVAGKAPDEKQGGG